MKISCEYVHLKSSSNNYINSLKATKISKFSQTISIGIERVLSYELKRNLINFYLADKIPSLLQMLKLHQITALNAPIICKINSQDKLYTFSTLQK